MYRRRAWKLMVALLAMRQATAFVIFTLPLIPLSLATGNGFLEMWTFAAISPARRCRLVHRP
ncbi:MAG: hypothetical protein NNA31_01485 [Nitrospira sp.]|nr:hypothetical protein [Nitrospira sp.]